MTGSPITVLVLAAGGNVSEGILKALALNSLPCRVIGADIGPLKLGLYTTDRAYISPWANNDGFLDWLLDLCRKESVQAILTGAEAILPTLACNAERIRAETGAVCIVSDPATLEICADKLFTCQWLIANGFQCPAYALSDDMPALQHLVETYGYPLLAKPRYGGGSRGLVRVTDGADLEYVARKKGFLVQRSIGDINSEYTAGCFSDRDGVVRGAIVLRRELHEGTTVQAEAGLFPEVREEAMKIAAALKPMGPSNIQIRLTEEGPVCFEINNRFSGTSPVRARFGFNDVEAALRHYVLNEPAYDLPVITEGIMLRYWNEAYVDPAAFQRLQNAQCLETPAQYPIQIEDYGMRP
ncbi:MAG TPA: ATP-grasp domain-containing protein [Candidatus Hydrogenedentes bacterium]|nr:ATP-grasp domain-containing protein [Candidatus Hydrogenedentota bacterium]